MAKWRQAVELAMTEEEAEVLTALSRSRTEPASRVSKKIGRTQNRHRPGRDVFSRRLAGTRYCRSLGSNFPLRSVEFGSVDPHTMQNDGERTSDRNLGLAEPVALGELCPPSLHGGPFRDGRFLANHAARANRGVSGWR